MEMKRKKDRGSKRIHVFTLYNGMGDKRHRSGTG